MEIKKQHCIIAAMLVVALATPSIALAQSTEGVFGIFRWAIELFKLAQESLGYLLGLIGLACMGFGVYAIIQHFRTESRDDPNQKSRLMYGIISFICGVFLANGAYQKIGSEENFTASIEVAPTESMTIVYIDTHTDLAII